MLTTIVFILFILYISFHLKNYYYEWMLNTGLGLIECQINKKSIHQTIFVQKKRVLCVCTCTERES